MCVLLAAGLTPIQSYMFMWMWVHYILLHKKQKLLLCQLIPSSTLLCIPLQASSHSVHGSCIWW
jgi:hypothetical protein